jgi:hypothetical protein
MIKTLHKDDTLTTPFAATKDWNLSNTENSNLVLMEHSSSTVSLEFMEYDFSHSFDNSFCSICLEQQDNDLIRYREGQKASGIFYPDTELTNLDGTFKRTVYSQIKGMFYNNYRDPTKIWGMEEIDFDKSQNKRFLSEQFRLYDVPVRVFGEKIIPNTVTMVDTTTDNDYLISDDGNGNLFSGPNLFSKQQEIGNFSNRFSNASFSTFCNSYFGILPAQLTPPVAGYKLWLHPESGLFNDFSGSFPVSASHQLIRRWNDASGYGYDCISPNDNMAPFLTSSVTTSYNFPMFGFDVDGKTGFLSPTMSFSSSGASMFAATNFFQSGDEYENLLGYDGVELLLRNAFQQFRTQVYHNSSGVIVNDPNFWYSQSAGISKPMVLSGRFNPEANTLSAWLNATESISSTDNGSIPENKQWTIGFRGDMGSLNYWHGHIYEVIIYDRPLSNSEMVSVQTYLMSKYSITNGNG